MRAEDLQIGDWVICTYLSINKPVKVMEIKTVSDEELKVVINYNGTPLVFSRTYIDPIPLTPEILENNGFGSHKNQFGFKSYELGKDYLLENRGDRFCLVRRMPGYKYSTFWICNCYYIHQVQHAIRLLGIDKEINL